ncbi:arsenite efflux transporter metallochaperone ArsD [Haladaptatus sp. DYF46]|uniref:arsenite efflux transporter metallochaperone ArsD n=1 Tax=Haladaptatus sp. DYF46 TaxID=2886041 RepID=UPI001E3F996C|nr:arsenite efflux transporter metallochaperone ArsD [Haladaptatus sp. DYF46]
MVKLTIYEEAMCCSTGICGPDPDTELVEVTHAVDKLEEEFTDIEITRANMSSNIERFLEHEDISDAVESNSPSVLPITTVDDQIIAKGEYLSYDELATTIDEHRTQEA